MIVVMTVANGGYVIYKTMYQPLILRLVRYVNKKWFREATPEALCIFCSVDRVDKSQKFYNRSFGFLDSDFNWNLQGLIRIL